MYRNTFYHVSTVSDLRHSIGNLIAACGAVLGTTLVALFSLIGR